MASSTQVWMSIASAIEKVRKEIHEEVDKKIDSLKQQVQSESIKSVTAGISQLDLDSTASDKTLSQALRSVEDKYLKPDNIQQSLKELVKNVVEKVITPALRGLVSKPEYTGSSYELTSVPGTSDYDIQYYLLMPKPRQAVFEKTAVPGWKKIKGGPQELQDDNGYLSADKARRKFQSNLGAYLDKIATPSDPVLQDLNITLSSSGPASTLNVTSKTDPSKSCSIDIVVCVNHEDLTNGSPNFDLTAKPFNKNNIKESADMWRMSYSLKEKELLRSFNTQCPRKLTLYRIIKVIKTKQPQLRRFPSYFYKNALFKLHDKAGSPQDWGRDQFAARFKDYIKIVHDALDKKSLTIFYNPAVNLLAAEDVKSIEAAKGYLGKLKNKEKYIDLVNIVLA